MFERDGKELERQVARDGNRCAQMVTVLVAQRAPLQAGDTIMIEEA